LALATPRTVRSRIPQALLAGLLIVGGALGGLLLFSRYNQRTPAVVVVAEVEQGRIIPRTALALTEVAADGSVAVIGSIDSAADRFAAHDLRPGELLAPADLARGDQIVAADQSVIGLLLEPGRYPTARLGPGDRVDLHTPGGPPGPLVSDLVVYDVIEASSDGRTLLVSVVAPLRAADPIFEAVDDGGIRISLRGAP
jgi:hypothetical protein